MFSVILSAEKNPDHKNEPKMPKKESRNIKSLTQASKTCRQWIEAHELGGGNWTGGQVLDGSGIQIASVSYNGRMWAMDGKEIV